MTKEHKEILTQGNDLLISQITSAIAQGNDKKEELREFLKKAIEAGDSLKALEDEVK